MGVRGRGRGRVEAEAEKEVEVQVRTRAAVRVGVQRRGVRMAERLPDPLGAAAAHVGARLVA